VFPFAVLGQLFSLGSIALKTQVSDWWALWKVL